MNLDRYLFLVVKIPQTIRKSLNLEDSEYFEIRANVNSKKIIGFRVMDVDEE